MSSKTLTLVIKTVERCNINCTYCYFFNGIDESYKKNPPYISKDTIKDIAAFIKKAIDTYQIRSIFMVFHGGEPLMQKVNDFDEMCQTFKEVVEPRAQCHFSIQTNAMLINDKWITVLKKYNVHVGISIDGPKAYHDTFRIDHRGKGTYERVREKLEYCQKELNDKKQLSVLCVINPNYDAKKIYRHFVDELDLKKIDFLLPDCTHDNQPPEKAEIYGIYLCNLFREWIKDSGISLRFFNSLFDAFFYGKSRIYGVGPNDVNDFPLLTISSKGDIGPVDELRSTDPRFFQTQMNVSHATLNEVLSHPTFQYIKTAQSTLSNSCRECCWSKVCFGGALVNRYSKRNNFNNASVYCEGLKHFYGEVAEYLLNNGLSYAKLEKLLCID